MGVSSLISAQSFTIGAAHTLYDETDGQPFLVNRLAAIVTEEISTDRKQPVTHTAVTAALAQLLEESNYHFEALLRRANEYRTELLNILFGVAYPFNRNNPLVRILQMYGIITRTDEGNCRIANSIYSLLLAAFQPPHFKLQGATLVNGYDFRAHVVNGELQMD